MKKNKMLRMASALLVLTLLTTSMIGGTFAKYTTEATGNDTARVAKWGVKLAVSSDLFAESYKDTAVNDNTATVKTSATGADIVAPGTTGKGLIVKNTATSEPEVSYNMTIKLANTSAMPSLKYTPNGGAAQDYEPVKFNVYNNDTKLNNAPLTLAGLEALFADNKIIYTFDVASGKYTVDSNLNGTIDAEETNAANTTKPNIKVEWVWNYEDGADDAGKALYDELDTILGNAVAGTTATTYSAGGVAEIKTEASLNWTVTATQIN